MDLIEILRQFYNGFYLGENNTILTIYVQEGHAREFYNAFLEVVQPYELRTELVYEFVDESDAIVVKGKQELILLLAEYIKTLEGSFKSQDFVSIMAAKSFTSYVRAKFLGEESWSNMSDFNVWACQKCGHVMLWGSGRFPLQQPLMCPACGSYMYQKTHSY